MVEEKKIYLTKEGLEKLKKEQDDLKRLVLAKTRGESPKVLESENLNTEYLALQEDVDLLEARLLELDNALKNAVLIKPPAKTKRQIVNLGATVVAELDGKKGEFKVVGSLEADPASNKISNESPIGKAILGRKAGEKIVIKTPVFNHNFKILRIKYNNV